MLAQPAVGDQGFTYSVKFYPDYQSFFGSNATAMLANVQRFRIVGSTIRAQATSPVLYNGGRLTAVRLDNVAVSEFAGSQAFASSPFISGLSQLDLNEMSSYPGAVTAHVNDGLTAWSVNAEANWKFNTIWGNENGLYKAESTSDPLTEALPANYKLSGWGNTVPLALIASGTNSNTTLTLELTQTVEYLPTPGSLLAGQCKPSPAFDPCALQAYKTACRELPVAVPRAKNDGFWSSFLDVLSNFAAPVGAAFGPKGALLGATVSTISSGLRSMMSGLGNR
jgi:hypothetical protein